MLLIIAVQAPVRSLVVSCAAAPVVAHCVIRVCDECAVLAIRSEHVTLHIPRAKQNTLHWYASRIIVFRMHDLREGRKLLGNWPSQSEQKPQQVK
jgi:hypothetical protein